MKKTVKLNDLECMCKIICLNEWGRKKNQKKKQKKLIRFEKTLIWMWVGHPGQEWLYMDFETCGYGSGMGGTGWMWVDSYSFIFDFERANFKKIKF